MHLLHPLWLSLLIPWAVLSWWLLQGRRPRVDVPFVRLWRDGGPAPSRTRSYRFPPIAIVLLLLSLLLAILALTSPMIARRGVGLDPSRVIIVVDTGAVMTTQSPPTRLTQALVMAAPVLADLLGDQRVRVQSVPGEVHQSSITDLLNADHRQGVAGPNAAALGQAVERWLHEPEVAVVILISDQAVVTDDVRFVQITSAGPFHNVGISAVGARSGASTSQVMVRLRNDFADNHESVIAVTSGDAKATRRVALPQRGREVTTFVDMPSLDEVVHISIEASDDLPADNDAWLVRKGGRWRVELAFDAPPALRRIVATYARVRLADDNATVVRIVRDESVDLLNQAGAMSSTEPGEAIYIARPSAVTEKSVDSSSEATTIPAVLVSSHPITQDIPELFFDRALGGTPGVRWTPVVTRQGRPIVAYAETPARQVWVSESLADGDQTPAYVMFWTNVLDWVSGSTLEYQSEPLPPVTGLPPAIKAPGVHDVEGQATAYNFTVRPQLVAPSAGASGWAQRLHNLQRQKGLSLSMSPYGAILSLLLVVSALGLTVFWRVRTVD